MSSVLEAMLEAGERSEEVDEVNEMAASSSGGGADSGLEGHSRLSRLAVLMTRSQLDGLIGFLRSLRDSETPPTEVDLTELTNMLQPLPADLPGLDESASSNYSQSNTLSSCTDDDKALMNKSKKIGLANRISSAANSLSNAGRSVVVKRSSDNSSNSNSAGDDTLSNGGGGAASGGTSSEDASPVGGANGLTNGGQVPLVPRNPDLVMVIPILDGGGGIMPGFLSEEHVLNRSRQASRVVRMNLANLPGGGGRGDDSNGCAGEKRTRFSESHDGEGSIGNTSDNLEAISEASNHSDSSMEEDEDEERQDLDPINDTLLNDLVSANVSGRGTPNVSGRDPPSSQVTEGDELVGRGEEDEEEEEGGARRGDVEEGGVRALGENGEGRDQGDDRGHGNGPAHQAAAVGNAIDGQGANRRLNGEAGAAGDGGQPRGDEGAARDQAGVGPNAGGGAAIGGGAARSAQHPSGARRNPHSNHRPRIAPIGSRKNGEPDLEEKFGRFEINKPAGVPRALSTGTSVSGGEFGDETVSLVSDTWSTDVLASDTETLGEDHGSSRMGNLEEFVQRGGNPMGMEDNRGIGGQRNRYLDELSVPAGSGKIIFIREKADTFSRIPFLFYAGNSNNLLDVAETASEAWSIDVLASDSESLRLGDLDNEDTASVARSDDTRFTDDTTRR